jgi:hypothetical protein
MARKKRSGEKQQNRPAKPKYTTTAHQYHQQVLAPLANAYRRAMKFKNYEEAGQYYMQLMEARKHHRILLHRKEKIQIE